MSQCTARAKATGARCRCRARAGYVVCGLHGAGRGTKRGGSPIKHGRYSKFLQPEEVEDFETFKQSFDLNEDLAFAATKTYHAAAKVKPEQLPSLLKHRARLPLGVSRSLKGWCSSLMSMSTSCGNLS